MGAAILYLLGGLVGVVLMVRLIVFLVVASTPYGWQALFEPKPGQRPTAHPADLEPEVWTPKPKRRGD